MQIQVLKTVLFDQPVCFRLTEVKPNQVIKVIATMTDHAGQDWQSINYFKANAEGIIDNQLQPSFKGSYKEIDSWGIIWSMKPVQIGKPYSQFALFSTQAVNLELAFFQNKTLLETITIHREILPAKIQREEIQTEKVTGILFSPKLIDRPLPGIILIPGNNGVPVTEPFAALLAAKGYAVFIVAYYRYKQLPTELYDLPLEQFRDAMTWFKEQPIVDQQRLIAIGFAKGSEALLATASYFSQISLKAIIANAPSHIVWQGIGKGKPQKRSAWSLFNEPLQYQPFRSDYLTLEMIKRKIFKKLKLTHYFPKLAGVRMLKSYEAALKDKNIFEAQLPIQNINCPIIFAAGQYDQLWPSQKMAMQASDYLKHKNFPHLVELWDFNAGHILSFPGIPTTVTQVHLPVLDIAFGGDAPSLLSKAYVQYWEKLSTKMKELIVE